MPATYFFFKLMRIFAEDHLELIPINIIALIQESTSGDNGAVFLDQVISAGSSYEMLFKNVNVYAEDLYWKLRQASKKNETSIEVIVPQIRTPWGAASYPFISRGKVMVERALKLEDDLKMLSGRIGELGSTFRVQRRTIPVPNNARILIDAVISSGSENLKRAIARRHYHALMAKYRNEEKDLATAIEHGQIANELESDLVPGLKNNLGYLHLAAGQYSNARDIFLSLIEARKPGEMPLALYNLAIAHLMLGDKAAAHKLFAEIVESANRADPELGPLCVFVPTLFEGRFRIEEKEKPNLVAEVEKALSLVNQ